MLSPELLTRQHLPLNREQVFEDLCRAIRADGRSIATIAELANVHYGTIYKWLDRITMSPKLTTMVQVAKAMGYKLALVPDRSH